VAGNADALRNVASQYQAIHNLVTGALHVSEQSAAARVGWTGLAADNYDTMRAGSGHFSNGTELGGQGLEKYLDQQLAAGTLAIQNAQSAEAVMAELAMVLEQAVGWFNTQAHMVDETNSFLHSVLFEILIAVVSVIVAIAAAFVAPFILSGLGAVSGLVLDAASALSVAARGLTSVAAGAGRTAATDVVAGAAADAGVAPAVVPVVDGGVGGAPVAGAAADAGVAPPVVPVVDGGAGGAPVADTGAGAATPANGTAGEISGQSPLADPALNPTNPLADPALNPTNPLADPALNPTNPLASSAEGSAGAPSSEATAGSPQVTSEIQPAPLAAQPTNGGAGAAAEGTSALAARVPGQVLPSYQELAHGVAMVLTQSGTDAAGQTLVQMVQSAIEHHGQFWRLSKHQGLYIAGSALGIPLAQAFNLALRNAPLLGRTLVDGALNWKLPTGFKLPASLQGKPGINIWFTYGNAGVAAYGLDQQFTHQKFSVVAALISYAGYGVLATADQALGKVLPGLVPKPAQGLPRNVQGPLQKDGTYAEPGWFNRPPLTPGKYANGKVPDARAPIGVQGPVNAAGHFVPPRLGGRGTGGKTGKVSMGPAGHGWGPDPRPYIQQTIPKIANRLWFYSLDHELVYGNGHLPGVQGGNDHYYFVLPTLNPESPPTVGSVGSGPAVSGTPPVVGSVPSVPAPPVVAGGTPSRSPGRPAPRPGPHPAPVPTPAEVTASYAQDQAALQAAQTALNQQIGQIQQLRGTLRQLPRTPTTQGVQEELTALQATIAAQQDEITRTQQLIGQLQSRSTSPTSILLVGPAAVAARNHIAELNSREDTISALLAHDVATVDAVRQPARTLPPVPVVSR
jgi:hypothetical protein